MKHDTNSFQEDFTTLIIPLYSKIIRSKLNMLVNSERVLSMLDGGAIGHIDTIRGCWDIGRSVVGQGDEGRSRDVLCGPKGMWRTQCRRSIATPKMFIELRW
jgi:hypothetical protein